MTKNNYNFKNISILLAMAVAGLSAVTEEFNMAEGDILESMYDSDWNTTAFPHSSETRNISDYDNQIEYMYLRSFDWTMNPETTITTPKTATSSASKAETPETQPGTSSASSSSSEAASPQRRQALEALRGKISGLPENN